MRIGGNIDADIMSKVSEKNEIGEVENSWARAITLHGYLDLMNGDSKYSNYDAKIQESTHIFVCDYVTLPSTVSAEGCRMSINGKDYDILYIDDPMELHKHLEIYLKFIGGQ